MIERHLHRTNQPTKSSFIQRRTLGTIFGTFFIYSWNNGSLPYLWLANSTAFVMVPLAWPENNVHMKRGDSKATISLLALQNIDKMFLLSSSPSLMLLWIKLSELIINNPAQSRRFPKKFGC